MLAGVTRSAHGALDVIALYVAVIVALVAALKATVYQLCAYKLRSDRLKRVERAAMELEQQMREFGVPGK
jgi:hypothetical protein